jgi:hypothetical protein
LEPLFGVLFSLYKGKPNHGPWVIACLQGAWSKLLGERLGAVCRPARLEDSDLRIEILDQQWESAVKSVKSELLEKLRTATANEVKTISFGRQSAGDSRQ